jgi:hypothetical protein
MSAAGGEKRGHLLLWGESASGKSTLLVAGLNAIPPDVVPIDWRGPGANDRAWVLSEWRRVAKGYPITQTSDEGSQLDLPLLDGRGRLLVKDIAGTNATKTDLALKLIPEAEPVAVVFVCRWPALTDDQTQNDVGAIRVTLPVCARAKIGLALTKCDRGLEADDPHWRAPPGWWAEHDCWRPYNEVLRRFGGAVWPTTAYGHDEEGRPACVLDEFGELMPYNIHPRNTEVPFRWAFQELGLWPRS